MGGKKHTFLCWFPACLCLPLTDGPDDAGRVYEPKSQEQVQSHSYLETCRRKRNVPVAVNMHSGFISLSNTRTHNLERSSESKIMARCCSLLWEERQPNINCTPESEKQRGGGSSD